MDAVEVRHLATAAISAGGIVMLATLYALFYALGQLRGNSTMIHASYGAFVLFLGAVWTFTRALDLSGIWLLLVGVLVVGYFVAPRWIWKLSVATHGIEQNRGDRQ